MEFQSQTASALNSISSRPLANYHPNIWGNTFLLDNDDADDINKFDQAKELIEELKEEVRRELKELDYMGQIRIVDAIQRLGIGYHFEPEIDEALRNVFEMFDDDFCINNHCDMYAVALSFRLLRQHGYKVSCRIFEKCFKDDKLEELKYSDHDWEDDHDIRTLAMGMLEFYEATHLRVQDEDVLENGVICARNYLESILPDLSNLDPRLAEQVDRALNWYSNRRGLPRLEARFYLSIYPQLGFHHHVLLRLAKLDFNLLQCLHQREISELYRWWKELDVEEKLPYIRDRMVETYFWILGVYFEPEYGIARKILTKAQALASILDDTYDAYGTFEELNLLTQAIERWDISCLDWLPEYMQVIYKAILELFQEIEHQEVVKEAGSYRMTYGKEAIKELARNYLEESKWLKAKYRPTTEEYMRLATKSCGYTSLIILSFLGINADIAKREAFDWVLSQPNYMVKATLIICRLTDDMVGHEFERQRDHIPSAVECYMNEHNVSKEVAVEVFNSQIEDGWKDLNQGFLRPTAIAVPLLYRILNFARVIEVMYKKGDWYTHVGPEMQTYIRQVLIDLVPE